MSGQSEFDRLLVKLEVGWHPAVIPNSDLQQETKQYSRFISGGKGVLFPPLNLVCPLEFNLPPEFGLFA